MGRLFAPFPFFPMDNSQSISRMFAQTGQDTLFGVLDFITALLVLGEGAAARWDVCVDFGGRKQTTLRDSGLGQEIVRGALKPLQIRRLGSLHKGSPECASRSSRGGSSRRGSTSIRVLGGNVERGRDERSGNSCSSCSVIFNRISSLTRSLIRHRASSSLPTLLCLTRRFWMRTAPSNKASVSRVVFLPMGARKEMLGGGQFRFGDGSVNPSSATP